MTKVFKASFDDEEVRDPSSSVLPSSLGLSDAKVYEPYVRARLGTTAHFCKVVVFKLRAVTRPYQPTSSAGTFASFASDLSSSLLSLQVLAGT